MGIDLAALKFLATAPAAGVDFRRTVMIGRQRLYVPADAVRAWVPGCPVGVAAGGYAEPLLAALGADAVDSLDASDYEGATVRHDLNRPLPDHLHARYTAVVEAGTLEHIFDFPTALRTCMQLAAPGGHVLCYTVANNFCGHGFYQFSPELFYRAFAPDRGFAVERLYACDAFYDAPWYAVADPAAVGRRVELTGPYPVMLLVQARRTAAELPPAVPPQQSDYAAAWAGAAHPDHAAGAARPPLRQRLRGLLGRAVWPRRSARQYPPGLFTPVPPPTPPGGRP